MRIYKRKLNLPKPSILGMVEMVELEKSGRSIQSVIQEFETAEKSKSTLYKYVVKYSDQDELKSIIQKQLKGRPPIFDSEQESVLTSYITAASDIFGGITSLRVRELAYKFSKFIEKPVPDNWNQDQLAGTEWCNLFMKRHPELPVQKSSAMSNATDGKQSPHKKFSNHYRDVRNRFPNIRPSNMYNMGETGLSTIHTEEGFLPSGKRKTSATLILAVSASGSAISPFFIFPRDDFSQDYLNNSPKDSDGAATGNGLMNENILLSYLHHFIKHSNCSLQNPVLLILNDHGHLLSFAAIDLAKKNGITFLALPPECGKELQPLDISVFAPLLIHFSAASRRWADRNENEMLSIHDIPGLVNEILSDAVKPEIIVMGFKWIGLQPIHSDALMDDHSFSFDVQPQETAAPSKQCQRMRRVRSGRRLAQTISSRTLPRRSFRMRQKREAAMFASERISIHFSLLEKPVHAI